MSSLASPGRLRAPRTAGAAIERARLALVPTRRSAAPRAPFAVLVFAILGAGVVGLLMFNTHMQQASFYATSLQDRADALAAERQSLEMDVAHLRDPQHLALEAKKRGMVQPPNPALLDLATGKIEGDPVPALPGDKMPVTLPAAHLPSALDPKPRQYKVYAGGTAPAGAAGTPAGPGKAARNSGHSKTGHGPASP